MSAMSSSTRQSAPAVARTGGSADAGVLQQRLGGPVGVHADRSGIWFNPAPVALVLATLTWLLCVLHQRPCRQDTYGHTVDALKRLCYSDIPIAYQGSGLATGQHPYRDFALAQGTVTAAFMVVARSISRLFGFRAAAGVTPQQELDASYAWFLASAVLLFVFFLALVAAHLLLGRSSSRLQPGGSGRPAPLRERVRSWDAVLVAGSPVVAAAGLVNWDMLAASLVGLALLAWAVRRPMLAGLLFGLAISSKFYPVVIVLGLVLLCARAGRTRAATRLVVGTLLAWLVANLPVLLTAPSNWLKWYTTWTGTRADLGSIWFLLNAWGVRVPRPGIVGALLFVAALAFVAQRILTAPRRPRVGQVAFLLVAALVLIDRGYPPQHALWLVALVVLARPTITDWAVFSIAELLYFWAVWGHLDSLTTVGDDPDVWYWAATLLHIGALLWISSRVLRDMRQPWNDPVRTPFTDDPVGGVLDHAPDADPHSGRAEGPRGSGDDDAEGGALVDDLPEDGSGAGVRTHERLDRA